MMDRWDWEMKYMKVHIDDFNVTCQQVGGSYTQWSQEANNLHICL